MFVRGLSDLIITIMAAGEVASLPVRDQRCLHEVLNALDGTAGRSADELWLRFGGRRRWRADPGAGRRAEGVTTALWDAVDAAQLGVTESGGDAEYVLASEGRARGARELMRLPSEEAALLQEIGARWARSSTSRKKVTKAELSVG